MRAWINQRNHSRILLFTAVFLLLILAWINRFVQDDAFISFRYARNLAQGLGLVWGPGQVVEGYSNFLWTLLISGIMALNLDPIAGVIVMGLFFFLLSLIFTFYLGRLVLQEDFLALIAVLLLGTNFTFSSFATGGLETQMQTALLLISTFIVLQNRADRQWTLWRMLMLGFLFSLALLTRLDSAVILFILSLITVYELYNFPLSNPKKAALLAAWTAPILFIVGSWFLWRFNFYGQLLPNTFYVKVSSGTSILRGGYYFAVFLASYWLLPFLILALIVYKKLWAQRSGSILILAAIVLTWSLYIFSLGGDFMEFRFMTPILPALMILLTWLIFTGLQRTLWRTITILLVISGSFYHMLTFESVPGIGSIPGLKGYMENPHQNWDGIGRTLGDHFQGCADPVTIAVRPAGAIPYYSGLNSIDMLGLNDPWIARNGLVLGSMPGHQRIAPFDYLQQQEVNLIIGHPVLEEDDLQIDGPGETAVARFMVYLDASNPHPLPEDARFLAIPIANNYNLTALYLNRNACIERAINQNNWGNRPVEK